MYVSLNYKDEFFCDVYEYINIGRKLYFSEKEFVFGDFCEFDFDCDFINSSIGNLVIFNKYITIIFYSNLNMQYY